MRIWGRDSNKKWVAISTDANGDNTYVYITALVQALKLNIGESPFYANVGTPAQQSVITQLFPDFYVNQMQILYSPHFASLIISPQKPTALNPDPVYNISIVTFKGVTVNLTIPT